MMLFPNDVADDEMWIWRKVQGDSGKESPGEGENEWVEQKHILDSLIQSDIENKNGHLAN